MASAYRIATQIKVSLFTREWIEIEKNRWKNRIFAVSLFTREWIEIAEDSAIAIGLMASPSLRGSGLKSALIRMQKVTLLCLPLYEGMD